MTIDSERGFPFYEPYEELFEEIFECFEEYIRRCVEEELKRLEKDVGTFLPSRKLDEILGL